MEGAECFKNEQRSAIRNRGEHAIASSGCCYRLVGRSAQLWLLLSHRASACWRDLDSGGCRRDSRVGRCPSGAVVDDRRCDVRNRVRTGNRTRDANGDRDVRLDAVSRSRQELTSRRNRTRTPPCSPPVLFSRCGDVHGADEFSSRAPREFRGPHWAYGPWRTSAAAIPDSLSSQLVLHLSLWDGKKNPIAQETTSLGRVLAFEFLQASSLAPSVPPEHRPILDTVAIRGTSACRMIESIFVEHSFSEEFISLQATCSS